ncbi:MFS transporter [Paenibacillus selenitireducens]|uniref:MFS transporter n=1 Tax=Paenibacillus selenitireducens TaxID=1324314 RepID=A0A1T2XJL1_9BACL|nr:MFS transporter [Paenibacillus selenitireducens]OPA80081.1 MFS transporter [Paenibacillus selenitireducens]
MNRKIMRSWMMYDWANSAFATTMIAAVLPIFYLSVAASNLPEHQASSYWGFTQTIAMIIVAVISPILGAIADSSRSKVRFLRVFAYTGVLACLLMAFTGTGDYILLSCCFILGVVGFSGGNTFYDSILADVAPIEIRDEVSAKGYMFGYIGGGVLLAINIVMLEMWESLGFPSKTVATQVVFVTVAVWWFLFSLPIFRNIKDLGAVQKKPVGFYAKDGFRRVFTTFRQIKQYPELLKYLFAFWFFNDGISTIISMATIYGKTIGIETSHLIIALLITQFVGIPFTYLFGKIASKMGSKKSLYISLCVYVLVVFLGYFMTSALHFYALAFIVGMVQGGSQSIARSIYSRLVPKERTSEFFGFLSLSDKVSASLGPALFGIVSLLTGSTRQAILSLLVFFIVGIFLLTRVNIAKGMREASPSGEA